MFERGCCKNRVNIFIGLIFVVFSLTILIGFVLRQFVFFEDSVKNEDELIFVHSVCRHGDRNMYKSFVNNPWNLEIYWPFGFAALTNVGKKQSYELGQFLRKRYAKLLGNGEYSPNKIYIRSTDVDRVLMTAQVTMAGLFPPNGKQKWNRNLNWQPIPVHTVQEANDFILGQSTICNRFDYALNEYRNSTEIQTLLAEKKSLIRFLEEKSGKILNSLEELNYLYDDLLIEQIKGYRLPTWAEEVMKSGGDLEFLANSHFLMSTRTTEMQKLRIGFLLKEMLEHFSKKINSTLSPDRSMWMYFAHDSTIANILNSFGLYELHRPPYASCLFFELYKTDSENYIQLFYRNSSQTIIPAMNIPNCGTKCPLNKWYEIFHEILPTKSFNEECEL